MVASTPLDILAVEDSEDELMLLRQAIEAAGARATLNAVRDGVEALAYLRREGRYRDTVPPGLLLVDLNVPVLDGLGLLREIRADADLAALPVVILTNSDSQQDVLSAYLAGANSFVAKPVAFDDYVETVRRLLGYWSAVARVPTLRRT